MSKKQRPFNPKIRKSYNQPLVKFIEAERPTIADGDHIRTTALRRNKLTGEIYLESGFSTKDFTALHESYAWLEPYLREGATGYSRNSKEFGGDDPVIGFVKIRLEIIEFEPASYREWAPEYYGQKYPGLCAD